MVICHSSPRKLTSHSRFANSQPAENTEEKGMDNIKSQNLGPSNVRLLLSDGDRLRCQIRRGCPHNSNLKHLLDARNEFLQLRSCQNCLPTVLLFRNIVSLVHVWHGMSLLSCDFLFIHKIPPSQKISKLKISVFHPPCPQSSTFLLMAGKNTFMSS